MIHVRVVLFIFWDFQSLLNLWLDVIHDFGNIFRHFSSHNSFNLLSSTSPSMYIRIECLLCPSSLL